MSHPPPVRLLCVEDNPDDVELMGLALARADPDRRYVLERVETATEFGAALGSAWDVVLCDYHLPRFSPHAALQLLAQARSRLPLVVVTRAIGEEAAVDVLRCGASDYVTKDRLGTLPQVIARVLAERRRAEEEERLSAELQAAHARLRELSAHLVQAQERERATIARELHDQVGQGLTALVVQLHAAERAASPEAAAEHRATAVDLAQAAIQQVKTMSFALRPPQLDVLGLAAAVRSACARLLEPAGIEWEVTVRGEEPARPGATAVAAFRLVQEALTNTVRHARAALVQVRLRFVPDGGIRVLVLDDGVGFDLGAVLDGTLSERNVGLYGMVERVELAGGRLRIRTRPGRGVVLRAVF